ncbi:TnpV protein [Roseburia sp.]|uniref:TnpV protein n=1 Tax=Roseburia sp. TaxID=2049040 RepID=UPI0035219919
MEKLEKVIVENGITYVLGEDDIYYPDLQLSEETNYNIGKFGHMRCEYLKEFRHRYYMELLLDGKLNEYLHEIDEECYEMLDRIEEQMKEKQGVTEELKAENQMMWVGKMNNIIACAEEIVVRELVYV